MQPNRQNQRDFILSFLAVFSLCSLLLNAVFVLHISRPSLLRDLMLSRLHPPAIRASDHVRGSQMRLSRSLNTQTFSAHIADRCMPPCRPQ